MAHTTTHVTADGARYRVTPFEDGSLDTLVERRNDDGRWEAYHPCSDGADPDDPA